MQEPTLRKRENAHKSAQWYETLDRLVAQYLSRCNVPPKYPNNNTFFRELFFTTFKKLKAMIRKKSRKDFFSIQNFSIFSMPFSKSMQFPASLLIPLHPLYLSPMAFVSRISQIFSGCANAAHKFDKFSSSFPVEDSV